MRLKTISTAMASFLIAALLILPLPPPKIAFADGEISDCGTTIDTPGTYVLTNDINANDSVCITITADNVTIDGQGHTIEGHVNGSGSDGNGSSGHTFILHNMTVLDVLADGQAGSNDNTGGSGGNITIRDSIVRSVSAVGGTGGQGTSGSPGNDGSISNGANGSDGANGSSGPGSNGEDGGSGTNNSGGSGGNGSPGGHGGGGGVITLINTIVTGNVNADGGIGGNGGNGSTGNGGYGGNGGNGDSTGCGGGDDGCAGGNGGHGGNGGSGGNGGDGGDGAYGGAGGDGGAIYTTSSDAPNRSASGGGYGTGGSGGSGGAGAVPGMGGSGGSGGSCGGNCLGGSNGSPGSPGDSAGMYGNNGEAGSSGFNGSSGSLGSDIPDLASAPGAPTIVTVDGVTSGGSTLNNTPEIVGTAQPLSGISVVEGVTTICSGIRASTIGNWSCTPGSPLSPGLHVLTSTATDLSEQTSNPSSDFNIIIGSLPYIANVTSDSPDGSYKAGTTIDIQVQFSEAVTVTGGTPTLTLETGDTDREAQYISGSESDTLVFEYTVQAGDTSGDLDYVDSNSLSLNGSYISAVSTGLGATLNLPGSSFGNLAGNKDIVIDTTAPGAPDIPDLVDASDHGSSDMDNLTNATTPDFNVSGCEVGDTVTLYESVDSLGSAVCEEGGTALVTTSALSGDPVTTHYIYAVQTDPAGNISSQSSVLEVTIDTVPPVVELTSPSDADHISGNSVPLAATASDDVEVAGVRFSVNEDQIGDEDIESPYTGTFDSTQVFDGSYNISATARDTAGNEAAATIGVVVENGVFGSPRTLYWSCPDEQNTSLSNWWNNDSLDDPAESLPSPVDDIVLGHCNILPSDPMSVANASLDGVGLYFDLTVSGTATFNTTSANFSVLTGDASLIFHR